MKKGRTIKLEQRPKRGIRPRRRRRLHPRARRLPRARCSSSARSTASTIPKGASDAVRAAAVQLVDKRGPQVLLDAAKCHFKTADAVLAEAGLGARRARPRRAGGIANRAERRPS